MLFDTADTFTIAHDTPMRSYTLGTITVTDHPIDESLRAQFDEPHRSRPDRRTDQD